MLLNDLESTLRTATGQRGELSSLPALPEGAGSSRLRQSHDDRMRGEQQKRLRLVAILTEAMGIVSDTEVTGGNIAYNAADDGKPRRSE